MEDPSAQQSKQGSPPFKATSATDPIKPRTSARGKEPGGRHEMRPTSPSITVRLARKSHPKARSARALRSARKEPPTGARQSQQAKERSRNSAAMPEPSGPPKPDPDSVFEVHHHAA